MKGKRIRSTGLEVMEEGRTSGCFMDGFGFPCETTC